MQIEGKIKSYQAERGFGFIQITGETKDLFFHIKDMPQRQIEPKVGERLRFKKINQGGKFKAVQIHRLDLAVETIPRASPQARANTAKVARQPVQQKSSLFTTVGLMLIGVLAVGIYQKLSNDAKINPVVTPVPQVAETVQQNFQCDGREHCSQMTSYEEAVYFLKHCPNTKMDGDGDGIPCESQF